MASSRKSRKVEVIVSQQLSAHLKPRSKLVVGLSGGLDSVVLLDVLNSLKRDFDFDLRALHVNHQISRNANEWAKVCRELTAAREIPLEVVKIEVPRAGSLEAVARKLRYQVFSRQDADFVALAQHLDDQVETFLLRLLRGAGAQGLAGMARVRGQGSEIRGEEIAREATNALAPGRWPLTPRILRPLLEITRAEILAYARKRSLKWIEDETNQDTYFDRNFLRQQVLPLIAQRWPAYRGVVSRAVRNLADSAQLLDELAVLDSQTCVIANTIEVEALRQISQPRALNLMRYFLRKQNLRMPDRARLEEALRQMLRSRSDAKACIELGEYALRRHQGKIYLVQNILAPDENWQVTWRGESEIELPQFGGTIVFSRTAGNGISLARLSEGEVTIRVRRGGERFRPDRDRPRRSLKNLLQERSVPPWERQTIPLLFSGETLVWVAGIGTDPAYSAQQTEPAIMMTWRPNRA
jgi:tRNA(Ile)-lysidine synthase